jgi:hypothetical protein
MNTGRRLRTTTGRSRVAVPVVVAVHPLGTAARGVAVGGLASGVRVHLGVEHQDVDVVTRRQHVVEATEADGVGPAAVTP